MVTVRDTSKTGGPCAKVLRHLNDRDAAASLSTAIVGERPDTLRIGSASMRATSSHAARWRDGDVLISTRRSG